MGSFTCLLPQVSNPKHFYGAPHTRNLKMGSFTVHCLRQWQCLAMSGNVWQCQAMSGSLSHIFTVLHTHYYSSGLFHSNSFTIKGIYSNMFISEVKLRLLKITKFIDDKKNFKFYILRFQ